jgi:drug/metabolite transporter (DMT)-like permease
VTPQTDHARLAPVDLATLVAMGALWGGSYLFIRIGAPALGPLPLMGGRLLLAALVLWAVFRAMGRRTEIRRHAGRLLLLGLVNAAFPFTLVAAAELRLGASLTAVLGATVPLFGALLSAVWLGERMTAPKAAGLALGLAGVAVLTGWSPVPLDAATMLAIGATLAASLSYAASGVYVKRALSGISAPTLALGQQVGAAAWLTVPALLMLPSAEPTPAALGALAALAVLSTALAFVLFFRLIARIGPTRTQTVTYITPAFGMLWGALFLGERITGGMLAGFALVAASMVLVNGVRPPRARRPLSQQRRRGGEQPVPAGTRLFVADLVDGVDHPDERAARAGIDLEHRAEAGLLPGVPHDRRVTYALGAAASACAVK